LVPDTNLSLGGNLGIPAWQLTSTDDFEVSFNVPNDFVNTANQTIVVVHFLTDNTAVAAGNVGLQLGGLFTAIGGTTGTPVTYTTTVTGVSNSSSDTTYHAYDAVFTLNQTIAAEDFALLYVTLNSATTTYNQPIYLTSMEFRYT